MLRKFIEAARYGRLKAIKAFLELEGREIDVNQDEDGKTALIEASATNQIEIVRVLLKAKADINLISNNDCALSIAARLDHVEMVNLLLDEKADINLQITSGFTALMFAIVRHSIKLVDIFLNRSADIDVLKNNNDESALTMAQYYNNDKIIQIIIEEKEERETYELRKEKIEAVFLPKPPKDEIPCYPDFDFFSKTSKFPGAELPKDVVQLVADYLVKPPSIKK